MEWMNVKFSDFLKERKGRFKPNDNAIQHLRRIEKIDFSGQIYLSDKSSKTDMILVKNGDLVISGINVEKGAMNIFHGNEDVVATIHYSSYTYDTDVIDLEFLKHFLKSKKFKDVLKEQVPGGIKTEIKPKHLLPLQIQIPKSLKDQRTIVNHLDNLYDSLNNVSTEITHQLSILKDLRQAFLREAMQGLLVSNGTSDGQTGADLLAEIKAEKEKLIKEKKIKKPKAFAPISGEDIPFDIPDNWTWCRLGEICTKITDGEHQTPKRIIDGKPLLSAKNVRDGYIDFDNIEFISDEDFEKCLKRCSPEYKDILIVSVGATIGRSSLLLENKTFALVRSVALIQPLDKETSFLIKYILDSPLLQNDIKERSWGTAQPCLYLNQINELLIPLPPLEIQNRIVAKLDMLMAQCDALESQIRQSETTNTLLLQQVLREALGA